jgi:hypothetical protein
MTPRELVTKAKDHGVRLIADGSILRCKCSRGLPDRLRSELLDHKPLLLAYLEGIIDGMFSHIRSPGDLPSEWWVEWDERAAIMEYEAGLSREEAEHLAYQEILKLMCTEQQAKMRVHDRSGRTISKNQ